MIMTLAVISVQAVPMVWIALFAMMSFASITRLIFLKRGIVYEFFRWVHEYSSSSGC